ncbi:MAG: glutaminyl-peptide cyclotransferase, partial [Holophagales bacterium]|nr:glutaminyl-peptide cyclotransferase [Holophagales bacterium]
MPSSTETPLNDRDVGQPPKPVAAALGERPARAPSGGDQTTPPATPVRTWKVDVLAAFPHDPGAFTQGLVWHAGTLYESTGLYGRSSIRAVAPASGQVLLVHELDGSHFGEGLALVGDHLVQLTWKAGVALVYDRDTFELVDQWGYNGEGWGLAYDGEQLIMSDGSPRLTFRSAEGFRWLRTLEVTHGGKPLQRINELEWVDGYVWANLWGEDRLVRIDPATGQVNAEVDASGLLTLAESRLADVMNGVAH